MTHEAGIEAATRFWGDFFKMSIHPDLVEESIQAYLSASGMVLVPKEATDDMINEAAYARPEIRTADFPIVYEIMIGAAPNQFKGKP